MVSEADDGATPENQLGPAASAAKPDASIAREAGTTISYELRPLTAEQVWQICRILTTEQVPHSILDGELTVDATHETVTDAAFVTATGAVPPEDSRPTVDPPHHHRPAPATTGPGAQATMRLEPTGRRRGWTVRHSVAAAAICLAAVGGGTIAYLKTHHTAAASLPANRGDDGNFALGGCQRLADISQQITSLPSGADPYTMLMEAADLMPSDWQLTADWIRSGLPPDWLTPDV